MGRKVLGVRKHGAGFQTYTRVNGIFRSASWPADTPTSEMTAWLRDQRAQRTRLPQAHAQSFEADAARYLDHVAALPTYRQRAQHIALWCTRFMGRRRRTITSAEIRAQRDRWLVEGLQPHTVNLRLRALSNLWTVLDGRRHPNPVRDVPEAMEPSPEPRSLPYWLAERVVARIPLTNGLERAQAAVMVTTGLTPVELSRLSLTHWHADTKVLYVQGRQKGHGGLSRSIPLSEAASTALAALTVASGWGVLPSKQFYRVFRRACLSVARDPLTVDASTRLRVQELRAYDLRHTFATTLYAASGDAHAAARILGHRSTSTTQRYIEAALAVRAALAVAALESAVQGSGPRVPATRARGRKPKAI